jgi:hypothetical protein
MSNRQFARWVAYFDLTGWPDDRDDTRLAALVAITAASKGATMKMESAQTMVNPWGAANRIIKPPTMSLKEKMRAMGG